MPTIKDVARLASTSTSTVSIILNGKAEERKISQDTQMRVRKAIARLGYTPNRSAQNLRSHGKRPVVALFWATDYRAAMLARFLFGVSKELASLEPACELIVHPYEPGSLSKQQDLNAAVAPYDGLIIGNAADNDLSFLKQNPPAIPTVLYNRQQDDFRWVAVDDISIGELAAKQLAERKAVLILSAHTAFAGMTIREQALARALRQNGTTTIVAPLSDMTPTAGYHAVRNALATNPDIDAIFAPSDEVGLGALRALHDFEIPIPDRVAVLAVGNDIPDIATYSTPSLSTVEIPIEAMAKACLLAVHEMICQDHKPQDISNTLLEPHLAPRASA